MWIEKKAKDEYLNSAPSQGIKITYANDLENQTKDKMKKFVFWLRRKYYFPIRCNLFFCDKDKFIHPDDGHIYYGIFFNSQERLPKRIIYPQIYVASKETKTNTFDDICYILLHELTHYFQWYFNEDEKRTDRSLEIEANRWARYLLYCYNQIN